MKSIALLLSLLALATLASAQTQDSAPRGLYTSGTLPATCAVGQFMQKTGASAGVYSCSATNTWSLVGGSAGTIPNTTHVLKGDGSGNGADTGFAAPASAFVGLTDTQTLTNKAITGTFTGPLSGIVSSGETVSFSSTPTFSVSTRASYIVLTGAVTSFTLAAGADGQQKALMFCQNGAGNFTVTAPANVHGFFGVGLTASKCSTQTYTYSSAQTAWLAETPGVINQ